MFNHTLLLKTRHLTKCFVARCVLWLVRIEINIEQRVYHNVWFVLDR